MNRPLLGCGYRPGLLEHLMHDLDGVEVWEHTVDEMAIAGDVGLRAMHRFAAIAPISLHSLELSVGSALPIDDADHLRAVARLIRAAGVDSISDHLGFCKIDGRSLGHFAPLWRVQEQVEIVVRNVDRLQSLLDCRLLLENISLFFDPGGDISHFEFFNQVTARTGCGVLLDISNLFVNHFNGFLDMHAELATLDLTSVGAIHLGGSTVESGRAVDAHAYPIPSHELALIGDLLPSLANCRSITIERDARLDEGAELVDDLRALRAVVERQRGPIGADRRPTAVH